jgi:hypothetical protein
MFLQEWQTGGYLRPEAFGLGVAMIATLADMESSTTRRRISD